MISNNMSHSQYLQENHISALAFNPKMEFCAIATKKNFTLNIFEVKHLNDIDSWKVINKFKDQTGTISEVDWSHDDKVISGSHDRSICVYARKDAKSWEKQLVNSNIKLSILACKWAPSSRKFGFGSACSTIGVGFWNVNVKSWTVTYKQKICASPITSISFHPCSSILALGSLDCSVMILSCSLNSLDTTK